MVRVRRLTVTFTATTLMITLAAPAISGDYVEHRNDKTIVDVPTTHVETDGDRRTRVDGDRRTRVKVRAPYTKVDVDTKRRHVRIRVPYYNGDIRW
jgi:hypothetical protein